ncbi:MAG TPA: hypothetical protein VE999_12510 [Gemmataceae bacterium]|nr:hypothetical protein [Gemmataceae bacterium]
MDVAERPCSAEFRYGASNGFVRDGIGTQIIIRTAREHSQDQSLAFEHPGARGKADWWHAVIPRFNRFNPRQAGLPSNRLANVAAPQLRDTESKRLYFTTKARKVQMENLQNAKDRPVLWCRFAIFAGFHRVFS